MTQKCPSTGFRAGEDVETQGKRTPFQITPLLLFLAPIFAALALFLILNPACERSREAVSGRLTILYTSDVGGTIDPCG